MRQAPQDCPVCGDALAITRLGCSECGTELSGTFSGCAFCGLDTDDREVLWVFLASRGNVKEVERHLNVSYPTARARVDAMLAHLGIEPPTTERPEAASAGSVRETSTVQTAKRVKVLEALARGELELDAADSLLKD